jgi:hypothetical protein
MLILLVSLKIKISNKFYPIFYINQFPMMRKYSIFIVSLLIVLPFGCRQNPQAYRPKANDPAFLHRSVKKLTDVIVYDIFSPPVASRIYAYSSIAAYEVLVNEHPEYRSLANQLKGLQHLPKPVANQEYCFPLASVKALLSVGRALTFSEEKLENFEKEIFKEFQHTGMPDEVYERSLQYGKQVADSVLAWASKDTYKQSRGYERYTVTNSPGSWVPTPPDYMDAVEPHWNKIRTLVMDSCNQFMPARPPQFSMEKESDFYKEALETYETGRNLTDEQKEIANFWDCNPFNIQHTGHFMFGKKKISPGGHWMSIASITCRTAKADIMRSAETYALVSISLLDGFISCWDEKYRTKLIRPETVINQHIDEKWEPLLTTPPFPEYPSGHSVISSASAVALTHLYGENFTFIDSTEIDYGLPPRTFKSFVEASQEAAISRLYGGIHYRSAIVNGVDQGKKVGNYIIKSIETRKNPLALSKDLK